MNITKNELANAAKKIGLSVQQQEELWVALTQTQPTKADNLSRVFYYLGALIVISAMGWFVNIGWDWFSGGSILAIGIAYALLFGASGAYLWKKKSTRVPGGLLLTISVCMVPLAIFGLEKLTGFWPTSEDPGAYRLYFQQIKGNYVFMEIGTIIAALAMLFFFRFPFLTAPLFLSLWFLSLDIVPLIFGNSADSERIHEWVSLFFGLAVLIISYAIDQRTKEDFAFWGYLFGIAAFWGAAFLLLGENSEIRLFFFLLLNVLLILLSVFLDRRILLIFGAIGVFYYVGHLATTFFEKSIWFPFVLSAIGVAIMAFGILYRRYANTIDQAILSIIPSSLKKFRPSARKI